MQSSRNLSHNKGNITSLCRIRMHLLRGYIFGVSLYVLRNLVKMFAFARTFLFERVVSPLSRHRMNVMSTNIIAWNTLTVHPHLGHFSRWFFFVMLEIYSGHFSLLWLVCTHFLFVRQTCLIQNWMHFGGKTVRSIRDRNTFGIRRSFRHHHLLNLSLFEGH